MSQPIRVAIFIDRYAPGGTQRQTIELLSRLDRRQFHVHAVCFHNEGAWFDRVTRFEEPVALFPIYGFRRPHTWRQFAAFARWCREKRIQVLHACELYSNIFALPAGVLASVPVRIGSRRGLLGPPGLRRIQRFAYSAAHRVVANCEAAADRLRTEGIPARKIRVIFNGLDSSAFAQRQPATRPRRVTVVAGLREDKRIDVLIDAVPRIVERYPDAEFLLAGDGVSRDALAAQARALGVADRVRFLGHRDDVANVLAMSDLFVLPSRSEAFPNAVMEAMASGLPVVGSRVGGIPELVEDGRTGRLVPPGDPEALATAILGLLGNPDLLAEFGREGRRQIERKYSFERMIDEFQELYTTELDARLSARGHRQAREPEAGHGNLSTTSGKAAAERRVS